MSACVCMCADQLFQCHLWLSLERPAWGLQLPPGLVRRVEEARRGASKSSNLHKQVSRALASLQVQHTNEHSVCGLVVDIALLAEQTVLEVDGPCHFCRDSRRELGPTRSKQRLLQRLGWRVLRVPYFEWDALRGPEEQRKYLCSVLDISHP